MAKTSDELDTAQQLLQQDINFIKKEVSEINVKLSTHFVTKEEFAPYRQAINLIASLVVVSVVSAMLALIFIKR